MNSRIDMQSAECRPTHAYDLWPWQSVSPHDFRISATVSRSYTIDDRSRLRLLILVSIAQVGKLVTSF